MAYRIHKIRAIILLLSSLTSAQAFGAECYLIDGDKKTPYNGETLNRDQVEKKSLTILNTKYPAVNAIEKTFKGEIQTCSNCSGRHIVCTR